ncbi:MAG TPA: hypothetical protein VEC57_12040 [Candidatus Limnocylindrales bacterium]|nr:hypothetical protein [Candidatus Limnocylindrales bacterium]
MTSSSRIMAAGILAAVCGAVPAAAGRLDHSRCERVSAGSEVIMAVDVESAVLGDHRDCTLGEARHLCDPADAVVAGGTEPSEPSGVEEEARRLCYRLSCPAAPSQTVTVTDRFGSRTATVARPKYVCLVTGTGESATER